MKKTVVVYGSSTGSCQSIEETIASKLGVEALDVANFNADVVAENDNLLIGTSTWGAGELHITFADGQSHTCALRIYSLSGSLVLSRPRTLLAAESTIQIETLAAGVYVVQIHADSPKHSGSTLVRLVGK